MKYIEQFIPCTVPVNAVFKDGERYPVICWVTQDISEEGEEPSLCLVGMIIEGSSPFLVEANVMGDFAGYEYTI